MGSKNQAEKGSPTAGNHDLQRGSVDFQDPLYSEASIFSSFKISLPLTVELPLFWVGRWLVGCLVGCLLACMRGSVTWLVGLSFSRFDGLWLVRWLFARLVALVGEWGGSLDWLVSLVDREIEFNARWLVGLLAGCLLACLDGWIDKCWVVGWSVGRLI